MRILAILGRFTVIIQGRRHKIPAEAPRKVFMFYFFHMGNGRCLAQAVVCTVWVLSCREVYRKSFMRHKDETVSATCNDTFARNRMISWAGLCFFKKGLKNSLLDANLLTIQRNLQF